MSDDNEKRGPGRPKVTETAEFEAAVAAKVGEILPNAVKSALEPILDALRAEKGQPAVENDPHLWAQQLAAAIRGVTDTDQGIKRIPPEQLAKMAHARAKMEEVLVRINQAAHELVKKARDEGEDDAFDPNWPNYQAIGKVALDEHVTEPFKVNAVTKMPEPVTFYYLGVPNMAMRPLNKSAREVFDLFVASIAAEAEVGANAGGKNYWLSANGSVIDGMHGIPVKHEAPDPKKLLRSMQHGPGQFHPGRDTINVLGTIAPPARQSGLAGKAA